MLKSDLQHGDPPAELVVLEQEKSRLLFEARLLKGQQQYEQAANRFIKVAQIEKQWAEWAEKNGFAELAFIHRYSELSCWAQAGNPFQALGLITELLVSDDLLPEKRADLEEYRESLHVQFVHWMSEWSTTAMPAD